MIPTQRKNRIVVGFDGSAISLAALKWATEEARSRDSELWVVHVLEEEQVTWPSYAGAPPSAAERHSRLVRTCAVPCAKRNAYGRVLSRSWSAAASSPPPCCALQQKPTCSSWAPRNTAPWTLPRSVPRPRLRA